MRTPRGLIIATVIGLALAALVGGLRPDGRDERMAVPSESSFATSASPPANHELRPRTEASDATEATTRETRLERAELDTSESAEFRAEIAQNDSVDVEHMRSTLARTIAREFPHLALSENELDDLASAAFRLRNSQVALRNIPKTVDTIEERAEQRRHLEEAIDDFTYILEMSPAEFSKRVATPGNRIDVWDSKNPPHQLGEIRLRPIRSGEVER